MKLICRSLCIALLSFSLASQAFAAGQIMQKHELTYAVKVDFGFRLSGVMTQTLTPKNNNAWLFQRKAIAWGFKAEESSQVSYSDNSIRSLSYKKKDFGFSNTNNLAFAIGEADTYDTVTLVLRLAHDLNNGIDIEKKSYRVQTDRNAFENYKFKVLGTETLSTKIGPLSTLKIEKNEKKGKQTTFWFYPDAGHIIVQAVSIKSDGSYLSIKIKKGTVNNTTLRAK